MLLGPASEEQNRLSDWGSGSSLRSTLLDESTERSDTGSGANHDNRLGWVGGELEVGVADVYGDVDAIVLVPGAGDLVGKSVGVWVGVAVLLLLECQEVVGGYTLEGVRARGQLDGLDHSGDGDLGLLDERRGRNGVVAGLDLVDTLNERREGDVGPDGTRGDEIKSLGDVEELRRNLAGEVLLVGSKLAHLSLCILIRCECSQRSEVLTGDRGADFHVIAGNSLVGGRGWERNLGSWVEGLDSNNRVALLKEASNLEESLDFLAGVGGPDGNVVTSLVREV